MSFFKKLKERLTRSSNKIDEDFGDLLPDGDAEEAAPEAPEVEEIAPEVEAEPAPKEVQAKKQSKPVNKPQAAPEPEVEASPSKEEPQKKRRGLFRRKPKDEPEPASEVKDEKAAPSQPEVQKKESKPKPENKEKRVLDDDLLEELEERLIMTDIGADMALQVSAALSAEKFGKSITLGDMKSIMAREIAAVLDPVARPMPLGKAKPQVVLVVGVNGSGKTTTIGKLASQFRAAGKSVLVAACDTFRAAAVEQLAIWGERADVPVMKAEMNSDPAALAYAAMERASKEEFDILMVDTAGRLQNRTDLMEELGKIRRVLAKHDENAPHNTILVLDATTGQNALRQVEEFSKVSDVTGLVMTKLDGTAKGGILVALAKKFGKPIHAIGVGEGIDDLQPFDPDEFARALAGLS